MHVVRRISEKVSWSLRLASLGSSFVAKLHIFLLSFRIPLYNRLGFKQKSFRCPIRKFGRTTLLHGSGRYEELLLLTEIFLDQEYKIPESVNPIKTIVDCGANIGFASVFYALAYPDAIIHAYEPDPTTFALLTKNAKGLSIICHNEAISDTAGTDTFYVHPEKHISSSLFAREKTYKEISVKTVTLEDVVREAGTSVDVFKFDIEGGEFRIFKKDQPAIANLRYITGEIHPDIAHKDTSDIVDALAPTHTVTLIPVHHIGRYICHALRR
jgi:FkbM family methyltransferase